MPSTRMAVAAPIRRCRPSARSAPALTRRTPQPSIHRPNRHNHCAEVLAHHTQAPRPDTGREAEGELLPRGNHGVSYESEGSDPGASGDPGHPDKKGTLL